MIDLLAQLDESIFLALHHLVRGPSFDHTMWLVSDRWIWIPMYAALAWLFCRKFGWRRGCLIIAAAALAATCSDQLCATVIRPVFERLRPANLDNPLSGSVHVLHDYRGGAYGFPSCHAANTVMLATFVALLFRSRVLIGWMFLWALLNCLSRIYLGVHYPGDLLFGAIIGASFACLWWYVLRLTIRHLSMPELTRERVSAINPVVIVGALTLLIILAVLIF